MSQNLSRGGRGVGPKHLLSTLQKLIDRRSLLFIAGLLAVLLFFQNCGGPFQATRLSSTSSSSDFDSVADPLEKICEIQDPVIRRLSRMEYLNATYDLLGANRAALADLPADRNSPKGFLNAGESQELSLSAAEKYIDAAMLATESAFAQGVPPEFAACLSNGSGLLAQFQTSAPADGFSLVYKQNDSIGSGYYNEVPNTGDMVVNGDLILSVPEAIAKNTVTILLTVRSQSANGEWPIMDISWNGTKKLSTTVQSTTSTEVRVDVSPASQASTLKISFYNNKYVSQSEDINLYIDQVSFHSSMPAGPEIDVATCTEEAFLKVLTKAFRRPPTQDEINRFSALLGNNDLEGLKAFYVRLLSSPQFLFVLSGRDLSSSAGLESYFIAEKLALALWGSLPDHELLSLAEQGQLASKSVLSKQIDRMMQDPKFEAFLKNYFLQWFGVAGVEKAYRSPDKYPQFDEQLAKDMKQEVLAFVADLVQSDRPLSEMITANYTFLNQNLAQKIYGLDVSGEDFIRVDVPSDQRRGVLTMPALMTVTSNDGHTSVIKRGNSIAKRFLCNNPPPPPADAVEELRKLPDTLKDTSERGLAEYRLSNPQCMGCHTYMDPIGLGLENYDPVGQFRVAYEDGTMIDSSSRMMGEDFHKGVDMAKLIAESDLYANCTAEHLSAYVFNRILDTDEQRCVTSTLKQTPEDTIQKKSYKDLLKNLLRRREIL